MEQNNELITITKERFEELLYAEKKLMALMCHGVDNWAFYGDVMESLEEDEQQ